MDLMPQQVDVPWRKLQPMKSRNSTRLLEEASVFEEETMQVAWQELKLYGGPSLNNSVPKGLHPWYGPHAGVVLEQLQPM